MYQRLSNPLLTNDFFIFGARGTGKSSLLESLFRPSKGSHQIKWIDLLDASEARRFILNPNLIETEVAKDLKKNDWIIIDEVQKVPKLLDFVHRLIEKKGIRFALTGSSARKLKRAQANLLAGRAFVNYLHPLTATELGSDFNLLSVLSYGALPKTIDCKSVLEKNEFLYSYVNTYLKEEIKEEQLVRNIEPFLKFLEVSSQCNGKILNYSKIARDCGTDPKVVSRYYEILTDTLLGFFLEPFHESVRKRQMTQSKFYFFDLGVKRALENMLPVDLVPKTYAYGDAFEHFFILECIRLNDYMRTRFKFSYLKTKDDLEIDLIIERPGKRKILIEIKSSESIKNEDFNKYEKIVKDIKNSDFWVVSQVKNPREESFFKVLNWKDALKELFF